MRIPLQISVILPLLVAAIVFCGCGRSPEREALERAEAVMEERPDSALAIVGTGDFAVFAASVDRACPSVELPPLSGDFILTVTLDNGDVYEGEISL